MSGAERDIALDPRPGDALRSHTLQRTVVRLSCGYVLFRSKGRGNTQIAIELADWRKWAATAEVVHRAEVAE